MHTNLSCEETILQLRNKMNRGRLLVSQLVGGDYAHAGEKESTEMVMQKVLQLSPKAREGNCLDIGCGSGGTANAVREFGFPNVYGIDIDQAAIAYAKARYPQVQFTCGDASALHRYFDMEFFSLTYFFNVFYAIEDKLSVLKQIAAISKPRAVLAIFDIYLIEDTGRPINDLDNLPIYLIRMEPLKRDLQLTGWEISEIVDVSDHCVRWYGDVLNKLSERYTELSMEFSQDELEIIRKTLDRLFQGLKSGSFGAAAIYAHRL